jgi:hypothetical protein
MNGIPHEPPRCTSPVYMLLVTVGGVACAEFLFELLLYVRPSMPPHIEAVLDAGFVVVVTLPLVYMTVFRPMRQLIGQYELALKEVKTLRGIIPICSNCKNIRTGKQSWEKIEEYVRTHSEADFSHGLCPECVRKLYPDLADEVIKGMDATGV